MAQFFDRSPTSRTLQQTKHLNDQVLKSHRQHKGAFAEEQRRRLAAALKEGREKAKQCLERLKHLAVDEPKHRDHEDHVMMHGAEELDHFAHELERAAHETHTEVARAQEHGLRLEQAEQHHGGELFQVVVAFILLVRAVQSTLRPSKVSKVKQLGNELKAMLQKVKRAAKKP